MFYKWSKLLAANTILDHLSYRTTVITGNAGQPMFAQSYGWENLQVIQAKHRRFSIVTMRDAADMLRSNGHIDLLENQRHKFDIQIKVLDSGIQAYREKEYVWDLIKDIATKLGWITVIASAITGVWWLATKVL
jgi:hypothetical protein